MTAEANVMRMASSTMSEASMNTWLAASAAPRPTTAMPPQVMPLASSSQMNMRRHCPTFAWLRGSARKLRQAAIMKNLTQMTVASHADACDDRRPEHRGQREDDGEQRKGDARGKLVARVHREQLVFEFGLDARSLRQARAHLAQLRLGDGAGILGARVARRLRVGRCLSGADRVWLRLGHRMRSCDTGIGGQSGRGCS